MDSILASPAQATAFELRFACLYNEGRGLSFPCDAQGGVLLDRLSERARDNYLRARSLVGREFAFPAVRAGRLH